MNQIDREAKDMQIVLGRLLQVGVSISAFVVLAGACVLLVRHHAEIPGYDHFHAEPESLRTVPNIIKGSPSGARNLIQLGLVLLIATPVARVAFSVYTFIKEKDRLYAAFTLAVLVLLGFSLLGSK